MAKSLGKAAAAAQKGCTRTLREKTAKAGRCRGGARAAAFGCNCCLLHMQGRNAKC